MSKKPATITIHESELAVSPGADRSPGLDTLTCFKAVALYRSPQNAQEYIAATITLDDLGRITYVDADVPCEYRIAAMSAKTRFSQLFLHGPVDFSGSFGVGVSQ